MGKKVVEKMTRSEIMSYIKLGRDRSICVDRRLTDKYPGYVRDIIIFDNMILRVEFNVYGHDEGGLDTEILYKDYDCLLKAVEDYIGSDIEDWENVTRNGWYPTLETEVDFEQSGNKLKLDFVHKTLSLPAGGIKYEICGSYWQDLAEGKMPI